MPEISLYRKYRPQNFENLVGQEHVRKTLLNSIKNGQASHAYLFCGPRGTGKTTTARLIAKALNCLDLNENGEPCEKCAMCESTVNGSLIDLIEIDAASNRGIDEIRDLREKIKFAPSHAKKKIYIIDEVHMLTKEAFNALLKTLEEPPAHAHFILATTQAYKIPETIISRCQRFDFKRIDEETIIKRLEYISRQEKIQAEPSALKLIAKIADGGMRDAIGLLEQMSYQSQLTYDYIKNYLGITGHKFIEDFFNILHNGNTLKAVTEINNLYENGYDLNQFSREFIEYLREKMLAAVKNQQKEILPVILEMINRFQEALNGLKNSSIPQLPLEIAIIKIMKNQKSDNPLPDLIKNPKPEQKEIIVKNPVPFSIKAEAKAIPIDNDKSGLKPTPDENAVLPLVKEEIEKNWARILERLKTSFIKRSLEQGKVLKVEGRTVFIVFGNSFYLEKINEAKVKEEISRAFEELFGPPIIFSCGLSKINLDPNLEKNPVAIPENMANTPKEIDELAKKTADIFGGEIIEE